MVANWGIEIIVCSVITESLSFSFGLLYTGSLCVWRLG